MNDQVCTNAYHKPIVIHIAACRLDNFEIPGLLIKCIIQEGPNYWLEDSVVKI